MTTRQRKELPFAIAALVGLIFTLGLAAHAAAASRTIQPGASLQAAVDAAAAGDELVLADGTHRGPVNFGAKADLTLRAASAGRAIITGGRLTGGTRITLRDFVAEGISSNYQQGAIAVGPGSRLSGLAVAGCDSLGVELQSNSVLEDSEIAGNGYLGVANRPEASVRNVTVRRCRIHHNNRGWATKPPWADYRHSLMSTPLGFQKDGRWYAQEGWEAGGGKFAYLTGLVLEGNEVFENGGGGLWIDCYVQDATVRGNYAHDNRGISQAWWGFGIGSELSSGRVLIEGNTTRGNAGGGILLWEVSSNTVRGNQVADSIGLRDGWIANGRRERANLLKDNLIEANRFYGQARISYPADTLGTPEARTARGLKEAANVYGVAGVPTWTAAAGPATAEAPATEPQELVDGSGARWAITAGRQLTRNGQLRTETNGVLRIRLHEGTLYQQATSGWWKWTGAGWAAAAEPPAATQPSTQPTTEPATNPSTLPATGPATGPATAPAPRRVIEIKPLYRVRYSDGATEILELP